LDGNYNLVRHNGFSGDGGYVNVWTYRSGPHKAGIEVMASNGEQKSHTVTIADAQEVECVTVTKDWRLVAFADAAGVVALWDAVKGTKVMKEAGHELPITDITYSPDDKKLASAGADGRVLLWDVAARKKLLTLRDRSGTGVGSLAFAPDGRTLAAGLWDGSAIIWDVNTGRTVASFQANKEFLRAVAFAPDGKILATGSSDHTARLWSVPDRKLLATLAKHTDSVNAVAFSPNGKFVATGSSDETVKIWDIKRPR
jgi:WD40 repeat protein